MYDVLVISISIEIIFKLESASVNSFIFSETSSVESVITIMHLFTEFFALIGVVNVLYAFSNP